MEFSDAYKEPTLHENIPLEKIRDAAACCTICVLILLIDRYCGIDW